MLKEGNSILRKYKKELYLFVKAFFIVFFIGLVLGILWLYCTFERYVVVDDNLLRAPRSYDLNINSELSRFLWHKKGNRIYYAVLEENKESNEELKEYFVQNNAEKIDCVGEWLKFENPTKHVLVTHDDYFMLFVGYNFKDFYSLYYEDYCE